MNQNPLQYLPVEVTECKELKVLDLSNTYVKVLPLEISTLKHLFDLNLDGCPLVGPLQQDYQKGIVHLFKVYGEKLQREGYREKLVKLAKEEVWLEESQVDIQNAIGKILTSVENDDLGLLRKLFRNLKYLIPPRTDLVDPYIIRQNLLESKVNTNMQPDAPTNFKDSMSKSMFPGKSFNKRVLESDLKLHAIEDTSVINLKDQTLATSKRDHAHSSEIQIIGQLNASTSQGDVTSKPEAVESKRSVKELAPVLKKKAA